MSDPKRPSHSQPHQPVRELSTFPLQDFTKPPEHIGPYRILEVLGEGGMGVVYLAQQTAPVERRVALKVIKLGMDTKEVLGRFESERQALALMDHPNIARILEGGVTDEGRPFFVMEHVPGESITGYCDRHKLKTRERLKLFAQVCLGVQHAHQKGIIHRDVKPSNIQVMVQDGKPIPKVIDFGVAKATNRRLTERTVYTEQGQLIGTPAYMSPEQAEMTGLNVDTTTDIYSLGVLLYELLVGVLPFDQETLRSKSLDEVHRLIREVDPPRPSTRLTGIGEEALEIARRRQTDVGRLRGQLKGELDWVILKAMDKDRTRRYSSASELAADIERYLNHQPIQAHAPSTAYQLRKMVRRHTTAVGFVASVLVLIVGFGIWMSFLYTRATRAEQAAASEAETAKQVSDFMVGMFEVVDPSQALGETITAKEILDQGAEKIEGQLTDQPLIQARLMNTMGQVYGSLGMLDQSLSLLESALKVRTRELGEDHLEVAETMYNMGVIYQGTYNYDLDKALELYERSLTIREKALGSDHLDTAWSTYRVGATQAFLGNVGVALDLIPRAQETFERDLGEGHYAVAWCLNDIGAAHHMNGENEKALPLLERALAIKKQYYVDNHPDLAAGYNALGYLLTLLGQFDEAEPLLKQALAIHEKVLGPAHPDVGLAMHSMGELYRKMGKNREAKDCFERSLFIIEKSLAAGRGLNLAQTLGSLGAVHLDLHDYEESEQYLIRSIEAYEDFIETGEPEHPYLATCLEDYARLLKETGRAQEADAYIARANSIQEQRTEQTN